MGRICDRVVRMTIENQFHSFRHQPGELNILTEEVEQAIHLMKNGKATGPDDLPNEALKALDEQNIKTITDLCNRVYNTGYIPTDMKQSLFIPEYPRSRRHYNILNTEP